MAIDYLSTTQIEMFFRCPEQYRRRYIENEIIPPGIAIHKGSAIHYGAKVNYEQKIQSRRDLPKNDIIACSIAALEERIQNEGIELTPDEKSIGKEKVIGKAKDDVVRIADIFASAVAPHIQPVLVECELKSIIDGIEIPLLGIIDVVDEYGNIRDLKITGWRKRQQQVDNSIQLTVYWALYKFVMEKEPLSVAFDVIVDRNIPEVQTLESKRTQQDFDILIERIKVMLQSIKQGLFIPNPQHYLCDPRYCGYYMTCLYVKH